jgi:hypothetical protein
MNNFWKVYNIKLVLSVFSLMVVKFFIAFLLEISKSKFLLASMKFD